MLPDMLVIHFGGSQTTNKLPWGVSSPDSRMQIICSLIRTRGDSSELNEAMKLSPMKLRPF